MKTINYIRKMLMSVVAVPLMAGLLTAAVKSIDNSKISNFEKAVEIIKRHETIHTSRHWPFVGYGHRVLKGEKFNRRKALSEKEADALLRKDLLKNCAAFRQYGADSLLLGVLAYNIGMGAVKRSSIVSKLSKGDRDIRDVYVSYCRFKGKQHAKIKQRRVEEYEALFDVYPTKEALLQETPRTEERVNSGLLYATLKKDDYAQ